MPTGLCASTGMDALVHAVEGYITKGAWELTDMLHLKAIEIIGRSLRSAVAGEYAGREAMSVGQYIAGMGFSNVGLGIVHSMAHPLSAVYDIPHGKACAMLLTAVLKQVLNTVKLHALWACLMWMLWMKAPTVRLPSTLSKN